MSFLSTSTATTAPSFSSRSFDFSTRGGSFDVVQHGEEGSLPTQCYICHAKFSSDVHSVLQLCSCNVSACQQCVVNRMIMNEDLSFDCLICGFKLDSCFNTGILCNTSRAKDLTDKYLERAFRFFKLPLPPKKDATLSQYYPLLLKFNRIRELAPHFSEFLRCEETATSENVQKERRKLNVNYLKIQLARAEHLRGGTLADETLEGGNLTIVEKPGSLPLGPLKCLNLTKNVFLERLLDLSGSNCCGGLCREVDAACVTCHEQIQPEESILLSCNCETLMCRGCAIRGFVSSKNTYRKGITCPTCQKSSVISMSHTDKAKEEELSIIDMMVHKYSPTGTTYSSTSIIDLRKLLEHLYSSGLPAATKTHDQVHMMSFNQVQLELCRIYVHLERKKTKHEKIIKKEKHTPTKKSAVDEKEAEFDLEEAKGKKKAKKKDDKELELPATDQAVLTYENKEDENYFYEASQKDKGFDLPIGPLRLLRFRRNPMVELYLANSNLNESMDVCNDSIAELIKRHRFNHFKPRINTMCPRCTINPQNMECVKQHLKVIHGITRKDEVEKVLKAVIQQPVQFEIPSFSLDEEHKFYSSFASHVEV
jgi:hypothetical protein